MRPRTSGITLLALAGAVTGLAACAALALGQLDGTRNLGIAGGVLEIAVQGEGSPAVVFESGAGAQCRMGNWARVIEGLRGETKLFAYNRSGYGRSQIHRGLEHPRDVVAVLRQGLQEAEVEPAYLLVGHSLGGLYMNLFARLHPDEVAGLVLVDSSHPAQFEYLRKEMPVRHALMVTGYSTGSPRVRYELANMNRFRSAVEKAGPFPAIPLVVLTAGETPSWQSAQEREWWLGLQQDLATLSPRSRSQVVAASGHFIQQDRPQVVVEAIHKMIAEVSPGP